MLYWPLSVALQGLEAVARQCRQILQRDGRLNPVQLETRRSFNAGQRLDSLAAGEISRSRVSIADHHSLDDDTNYELRYA
jgi:hypothetical protein